MYQEYVTKWFNRFPPSYLVKNTDYSWFLCDWLMENKKEGTPEEIKEADKNLRYPFSLEQIKRAYPERFV